MKINPKLVGIRIMQKRKEKSYSQEKLAELMIFLKTIFQASNVVIICLPLKSHQKYVIF